MIPPVPPSTLATNPNFAKLHQHLIKHVLNPDGSTRQVDASHHEISDRLRSYRIETAKDRILNSTLSEIASHETLPSDLRNLTLLVASYITNASTLGLTQPEHSLLHQDLTTFRNRLPEIAPILAEQLQSQHRFLNSIASQPQTSHPPLPSPLQPNPNSTDSLSTPVSSQLTHLSTLHSTLLPHLTYATTTSLLTLLHAQSEHLTLLIRALEQRTHGAETRHLLARAQFLSTVAKGLEAKTKVVVLEGRRDVYYTEPVGGREGMKRRMEELKGEEERLVGREREVKEALGEFEEVGLETMRTLGRRYGEIEREVTEVKGDVERLLQEGSGKRMGMGREGGGLRERREV